MARTIDRPSPWWPSARAARPPPRRGKGSKIRSVSSSRTTGPVLVTDTTACPLSAAVRISTRPPGRLYRTALSTRFATRRSMRAASPAAGAGSSTVASSEPVALQVGARVSSTWPASWARSTGSRWLTPRSVEASVSNDSSSRSCSWPAARSSSQVARRLASVALGSASATCSSVRSTVSGVRSSCEALATKRRCASNEASKRARRSSSVSPSRLNSSSGPVSASR